MLRFRKRHGDESDPESVEELGALDDAGSAPVMGDADGSTAGPDRAGVCDAAVEGDRPDVTAAALLDQASADDLDVPDHLDVPDDADHRPRRSLRSRLGRSVGAPFRSLRRKGRIDDELLDQLEDALLIADVGLPTTTRLLDGLREIAKSGAYDDPISALHDIAVGIFDGDDRELHRAEGLSVWLFVGVNGAGKTTTIGKLAYREANAGYGIVVAAGDTFRAAAVEQLGVWADRAGVGIVEGGEGADPASVVFDAKQHAAARGASLVLADTAGRLHTKANLMAELEKVRRVADRPPGEVTEVLLVLDATTGQNGLAQARQFTETAGVTGIVLTKLDGSAKGGVVLAIRSELGVPIKLIGVGEGLDDLIPFDPEEFVAALLGVEE